MKVFLLAALSVLAMTVPVAAHDYAVGQIWAYHTRPGEESSRVLIDKIESDKVGRIFHISINNVNIGNPKVPSRLTHDLPHLPVSQETLDKSVTEITGTGTPNPEFQPGYDTWKPAFDAGKAGIWTITLYDIVGIAEKALNQ